MTDQAIRDWLSHSDSRDEILCDTSVLGPLLKELLAYRSFKMFPCWRVWVQDDRLPQGWRWIAAFPDKEDAMQYRGLMRGMYSLVLEGHEEPALTAR